MTNTTPMTRIELIRLIGDTIVEVDILRSTFARESPDRKNLDNIRDELDTYQRKLVRMTINENTVSFKQLSSSLNGINQSLKQTIDDVNKTAKTLEALVQFVEVVQKIAALMV